MWVEETKGQRINHARCSQAQESARKTGSGIVAVNCPFCVQMFEDGIPSVETDESKRMKTYDVAELLEQAVIGKRDGAEEREALRAEPQDEAVGAALDPPAEGASEGGPGS